MYIHSIMMQLLILLHQRRQNTCAWQMLMESLSTFNEEAGELSFSMLARCVLGDTQKRKFAHLNLIYQQIHFYGAVERELGADGAGFNKNGNWRKKLDPDGELLKAVTAHMQSVIRQISMKTMHVYTGKPETWRDLTPARGTLKPVTNATPIWVADMRPELDKQLQQCKQKFSTFWVEPYKEMWPEFAHRPNMQQLLPSRHRIQPVGERRSRQRRAEPEDLVVEGEWPGELEEKNGKSARKVKAKKAKKRKIGDEAVSENDSDGEYSEESDSEDQQEAALQPDVPIDEIVVDATLPQHASDFFAPNYGNIDQSNIRPDQPRQRTNRRANH
jgi:hypothetical protein